MSDTTPLLPAMHEMSVKLLIETYAKRPVRHSDGAIAAAKKLLTDAYGQEAVSVIQARASMDRLEEVCILISQMKK
jgi:hypothetical protein